MNRRLVLLAALLLAGCATTRIAAPAGASFGELEPLYAATATAEALTIRVASQGCTAKADFAFYVDRTGGAVRIAFGRKRLDRCRAAPSQTDVSFTWAELGLEPGVSLFLANPLVSRR